MEKKPGKVVVTLREEQGTFLLSVNDNGKGISPEHLAKIGIRGVTFDKTGTASGHGIGLAHAKESIESIGGKFRIESQVGEGTTILMNIKK